MKSFSNHNNVTIAWALGFLLALFVMGFAVVQGQQTQDQLDELVDNNQRQAALAADVAKKARKAQCATDNSQQQVLVAVLQNLEAEGISFVKVDCEAFVRTGRLEFPSLPPPRQGAVGATGRPGTAGAAGQSLPGAVGPTGKTGATGEEGQAIVGEKGEKGDKGEPGESIKGDKGDKGDTGEQGIQGPPGADCECPVPPSFFDGGS